MTQQPVQEVIETAETVVANPGLSVKAKVGIAVATVFTFGLAAAAIFVTKHFKAKKAIPASEQTSETHE